MYKNLLKKATTNQELSEEEIFGLINAINRDEVSDLQIAGFQNILLLHIMPPDAGEAVCL